MIGLLACLAGYTTRQQIIFLSVKIKKAEAVHFPPLEVINLVFSKSLLHKLEEWEGTGSSH